MQSKIGIISKAQTLIEEIILYWNHPRPGEYVTYIEITMLSLGWLAQKYYPDGIIYFDLQVIEDAFDLPDETHEQQKIRRKAMKKANKEENLYTKIAAPYLSALRTIQLAEGYENLSGILSGY